MKKIILFIIAYLSTWYLKVFATESPTINCKGLPFCNSDNAKNPSSPDISDQNTLIWFIANITAEIVQFTAVIWVWWIMITWIMLAFSWWNEEKAKNAKTYFIWSIAWTLLSSTAYIIINLINKIEIS